MAAETRMADFTSETRYDHGDDRECHMVDSEEHGLIAEATSAEWATRIADALNAAASLSALQAERERLREALIYVRESLGDPVPVGRRHVARKIAAALATPSPKGAQHVE